MMAKCFDCGVEFSRYACNTWSDPCDNCGSTKLWIYHFGNPFWLGGHETHRFLKDVKTGENLTTDECNLYYPKEDK